MSTKDLRLTSSRSRATDAGNCQHRPYFNSNCPDQAMCSCTRLPETDAVLVPPQPGDDHVPPAQGLALIRACTSWPQAGRCRAAHIRGEFLRALVGLHPVVSGPHLVAHDPQHLGQTRALSRLFVHCKATSSSGRSSVNARVRCRRQAANSPLRPTPASPP